MNWAVERSRRLRSIVRPNAFAVILFTERHANIRRVLHDSLYWDALNDISGDRWMIFVTMAVAGQSRDPGTTNCPPGTFFHMVSEWKEPRENLQLLKDFELDSTSSLPSLLVFGEESPGQAYRMTIKLDDSSIDRAYSSLKGSIGAVTRALDDIEQNNFSNTEGVFAAIDLSVSSYRQFQWIERTLPLIKLLAKLLKGGGGPWTT